jgi:hypothetical protein
MKILQCAYILGALAALYLLAPHAPARVGEPSRVSGAALAALADAHANLERDFAAFARAAADPMPVSSLAAGSLAAGSLAARTLAARALGITAVASADIKPVISESPKALAFDDAKRDAYFDPTPIGPAHPIVLASLGLIPVAAADLEPQPAKRDFSYLAYYAYSEVPPDEKPADTVLNSLKDVPLGTPIEEIRRAADAFGLDFGYLKAVAKIESGFDPTQRTGSYIGLYQLSKYEFARYGSGDILNPRDNAITAAYKIIVEAELFELRTHKKPSLSDLYLIHQQGIQGAEEHVSHPERIAWQSMCATDEGQLKGEKWCKRAIWQNTLPAVKQIWKSVDKLTSAAFVDMWRERVALFYARYSEQALVQPGP